MPSPSSGCVIESLEVRSHLSVSPAMAAYFAKAANTGTITGVVFNDANANGKRDLGERGVAGRTMFIDLNANGIREAKEPTVVTDADGVYRFRGLPTGRYFVRHLVPKQGNSPLYKTKCVCTTCVDNRVATEVTAGSTTRGVDFGIRTVSVNPLVFRR
jgi:hypothetical protein